MAPFVTPRSLERRAEFFQRLGQFEEAGLGVTAALQDLEQHPPARSDAALAAKLAAQIQGGLSLAEAMRACGTEFADFDCELADAGERSGRLASCLHQLSAAHATRARLARVALAQLWYPLGVLHFAVLVFGVALPFIRSQFTASLFELFARAGAGLLALYVLGGAVAFALQGRRGAAWRGAVESVLDLIPVLGGARRSLALARLSSALEAAIAAGIPLPDAWELAARASGSTRLRHLVAAWASPILRGTTPAELVSRERSFPDFFRQGYRSGETTGTLETTLRRTAAHYEEEGARRMQTFATLAPRLGYLAVVLFVAYNIVKAYAGYLQQVEEAWKM